MPAGGDRQHRRRLGPAVLGAAAVYALATVALTWPLFRHPTTRVLDTASLYGGASILIQRDINLTMWTLAWDSHALTTHPLGLFNANVFYPAPYTLALTEHMLGNVPLFTPVYLLTGNPVLAHQTALLLTFVLAGLAMAAWAFYWTEDPTTALAAGFFYAFAPYRFWQLGNLHVISIHYLPLVLLGIDATLDRRGGRAAPLTVLLAVALSSLCSYYIGYATFTLAGVYAAVGCLARGRQSWPRLWPLALAGAAAGIVVMTVTVPYLLLQHSGVLPDYGERGFIGLAFLGMLKVGWYGLLGCFVLPLRTGVPQFLTFTMLGLGAVGLLARRGTPRGALVAVTVAGAILSLGPYLLVSWARTPIPLPYRVLAAVVPGFSAMRVPQRFGALVTLAVAALAALGIGAVRTRLRARGHGAAAAVLPWIAVALFLFEATPRGLRAFGMNVGDQVPEAYRWLAAHGEGGPMLETPTAVNDLYRQSTYMYYSTYHWLPTPNGYAAYPPRSYIDIMGAAHDLPKPEALRTILERVPLRWLLVHHDAIRARLRPDWDATLGTLKIAAEFGGDVVYEVPPR